MRKLALFVMMFSAIFLSGCLPAIIGTAATGIVTTGQDRRFTELKSDIEIWTSIKNKFIQYNSRDLFKNVSVKVIEGRVLLTGNVEKAKTKILAEKISWIPRSVNEVINEINVAEEYNIKISAKDSAITTHIKTRLALEKNIKSNNYKIETVNGTVYVIGITKSKDELSKALDLISKINGVKKVINYVLIRPLE